MWCAAATAVKIEVLHGKLVEDVGFKVGAVVGAKIGGLGETHIE
jgi:hypothetical protein